MLKIHSVTSWTLTTKPNQKADCRWIKQTTGAYATEAAVDGPSREKYQIKQNALKLQRQNSKGIDIVKD